MAEVVVILFLLGLLVGWIITGIIYVRELMELKRQLDTITAIVKGLVRPEAGEEKAIPVHNHPLDANSASQFAKNKVVHAWWVGNTQQKSAKEEGIY